jgi:hypothetical protein
MLRGTPLLVFHLCITNPMASVRERTIPTERQPFVGEVGVGRGCPVVGATDLSGRNLGSFLDQSRYSLF